MMKIETLFLLGMLFMGIGCAPEKKSDALGFLVAPEFSQGSTPDFSDSGQTGFRFYYDASSASLAYAGDGAADGYRDAFATPSVVGLAIQDIVGFKPESAGGPKAGQEHRGQGESLSLNCSSGPFGCFRAISMSERYSGFFQARLTDIGKKYDRVGITFYLSRYYFPPKVIPDPNRRYWTGVVTSSTYSPPGGSPRFQGHLSHDVIDRSCPYVDQSSEEGAIHLFGFALCDSRRNGWIKIDTMEGRLVGQVSTVTPIPEPPPVYYPESFSTANLKGQELTLKQPPDIGRFSADEWYMVVFPVGQVIGSELSVKVKVANRLFWDTTDSDNIFDPANSAGDRPNSPTSFENLNNPARRNLILSTPELELGKPSE